MSNETLCCDYCGEENRYVPIVEKPSRFGYKGKIHHLAQVNNSNRAKDNICLSCLSEEIETIKDE